MIPRIGQRAQVAFAGDKDVFSRMPAGNTQQLAAQQIDAVAVLRGQRYCNTVAFIVPFGSPAREIDLVIDRDTGECSRQLRKNGALRLANAGSGIDQQHDDIGPFDFPPGSFNTDLLNLVVRIAQTSCINDVQQDSFA